MLADALALELQGIGVPAQIVEKRAVHVGTDEALEIVCGRVYRRRIWVYFTGTQVEVQLSGNDGDFYDLAEPGSIERIIAKVGELYDYAHLYDGS